MTPDQWGRVKAVVGDALEREPDERDAFVATECGEDTALRREVESMLRQSGDRLDRCVERLSQRNISAEERLPGTRLGAYEIVREIGRGGMGAVYLARRADDQFEKEVAIKILKRGTDTDEVLRRFRAERQILAQLEHPNIARLLDAGTSDDGLPFFVMEYVEGIPVTQYCVAGALTVRQRLELFIKVCGAVQFAHQNLVIHRDLKPGNTLVTAAGEPKLLDFGIAKLVSGDADSLQTTVQNEQRFTPAYASPEQIRGDPVTTASDVYSLGALLYELLAGRPPHRFETQRPSPTEIFRVIVEREPSRVRGVATDLDTIVRKALSKEPLWRYSGAAAFAEDLRRYLDGRPVQARPATSAYRAAKFIARNKFGVAAALLLLATLVGGIVATTWQARKAQRRFADVRRFARVVMFDYHDLIQPLAGSTPVRERLVRDALEYLNNLAREAANDHSLLRELATAYAKIGQVQGNSYYINLGDTEGAMQSYRRSLEIREKLLAASPGDAAIETEVADSYEGLGDVLYSRGELRVALEHYERALTLRRSAYQKRPGDPASGNALALLYVKAGDIRGGEGYSNLGDIEGALASYGKARETLEPLLASHPQNTEVKAHYASVLSHGSFLALKMGDAAGALRDMRRAVHLEEERLALDPDNAETRTELLSAKSYLHYALIDNNLVEEAIEQARAILAEEERLLAADPKNSVFRRNLGASYNTVGRDLLLTGKVSEAIEHHTKALAISEEVLATDATSEDSKSDIAFTLRHLGRAQAANGQHAAALLNLRKALGQREASMAADPTNARAREDVAVLYQDIGNSLAQSNDPTGAIEAFAKTIPLLEELLWGSPAHAARKARLADAHLDAGRLHLQISRSSGRDEEHVRQARKHLSRSLALWRDLEERNALIAANVPKLRETEMGLAEAE